MNVISARKCSIETIDNEQANLFVEENHRQGSVKVDYCTINIGMFHQGGLVAVAQFCLPRTAAAQRKYSIELLRLAFKKDLRIAGGASKLISYYKSHYYPTDIFTYQDATGELTNVYKKCGFTLVSQARSKQYLVAPGKTIATGSRKEVLGMPYATRYGPDRILGTKLGEVYYPDDRRKSNRDIFLEELGWHVEETAGDLVWEWFDPDVTFYTYRITAADSDKYYIGVSHVKRAIASRDECLNDGYWGSGGVKYKNWTRIHRHLRQKEVLETFPTKAKTYAHEKKILGDSYVSDSLCLNSTSGGRGSSRGESFGKYLQKYCKVCDSETNHLGGRCRKCITRTSLITKFCSVHNSETTHFGDVCLSCNSIKGIRQDFCKICQKTTTHQGSSCRSCAHRANKSNRYCDRCQKITRHTGDSCYRCHSTKIISIKYCPICGEEQKHRGESCFVCSRKSSFSTKFCGDCGQETRHSGDCCLSCKTRNTLVLLFCEPCGRDTKHQKSGECISCSSVMLHQKVFCPACNRDTKHRGKTCCTCTARKVAQVKNSKKLLMLSSN